MQIGRVICPVWATKKSPALRGLCLLQVAAAGRNLVAADLLGAGPGDRVLLSFGGAARLEHPGAPVDAAIVAILDQWEERRG